LIFISVYFVVYVLIEDGPFRPTRVVSKILENIKHNTPSCIRRYFFSVSAMISPANISYSCIIYTKNIQNTGITEMKHCVRCDILFIYSRGPKTPGSKPLWRLSLQRVRLTSLGHQYGACLTSPFWRLGLRDGFWIFGKFTHPGIIVYFTMLSVYRTIQGTSNCKGDKL